MARKSKKKKISCKTHQVELLPMGDVLVYHGVKRRCLAGQPFPSNFYIKPRVMCDQEQLENSPHWKSLDAKLSELDFSEEDAEKYIRSRIEYIIAYFSKLKSGTLTEEDSNKLPASSISSDREPYLPTYEEIKVTLFILYLIVYI